MPGLVTIMAAWNLIETEERRALSEQMAGWAEKFPGVPVDVIVSRDGLAHSLLAAGARAQLIVVGSRGRGAAYGAEHARHDRREHQMSVRIGQWTLDVCDLEAMAQFWAAALGYRIHDDGQRLRPPPGASPHALSVWLQPVDEPTPGKNRGHPDLVPEDGDADAEVERLLALGARHSDVGQSGSEGFIVLVDPEGNEFCVLRRPAEG